MPAGDFNEILLMLRIIFSYTRSTFTEAKFNADDYANELMELKKEAKPDQLKSQAASSSRKRETEEGKKKISFIEQANKRKECDKLAAFVMSIDLMLNHVLHQLVVNSMTTIQVRSHESQSIKLTQLW